MDLIRISIVDDDNKLRANIARTVNRFPGCSCVGQFHSGQDALLGVVETQPDIVLMDINMPGMNGIECVRKLKSALPEVEFIMLTVYADSENVFEALTAGASGYLLKDSTREELQAAIFQVRAGGSPMTNLIARKVVQAFRKPLTEENETAKLSPRQQEILELLAKGFLYKEIGEALGLEYATVHNYIRRIYEKLRVRSRSQAVAKLHYNEPAIKAGIGPIKKS